MEASLRRNSHFTHVYRELCALGRGGYRLKADRREALEQVRANTGRQAHLLEKDVWVVWALRALFDSSLATDLTFKGGTSLSKVYKIIDRFSEDVDLTYDIRRLIGDLIGVQDQPSSELARIAVSFSEGIQAHPKGHLWAKWLVSD